MYYVYVEINVQIYRKDGERYTSEGKRKEKGGRKGGGAKIKGCCISNADIGV
jgi:hypothetical protein